MQFTAPEQRKGPREGPLELMLGNVTDTVEALLLRLARKLMNDAHPGAGPSVSLQRYRKGNVAIAFSVLYSPFDELSWAGFKQKSAPRDALSSLLHQLVDVEIEIGRRGKTAMIARTQLDLAQAQAEDKVAVIHCVEGGFHLGKTPHQVEQSVIVLRRMGVAYITLAHLLYRRIATCMSAFPAIPDAWFHRIYRQPDSGLTKVGRAAVKAMVGQRILIDVTHMSERSMVDTFALLDQLDPAKQLPVIASHMACRFGTLEYNLQDSWLQAIHARGGVIGVIMCDHYMNDGLGKSSKNADESFAVICKHIDRIRDVTGSYDAVAIGSDHDGFIKPTLEGFEHPGCFADLSARLEQHYGTAVAAQICSQNVRRVLSKIW